MNLKETINPQVSLNFIEPYDETNEGIPLTYLLSFTFEGTDVFVYWDKDKWSSIQQMNDHPIEIEGFSEWIDLPSTHVLINERIKSVNKYYLEL